MAYQHYLLPRIKDSSANFIRSTSSAPPGARGYPDSSAQIERSRHSRTIAANFIFQQESTANFSQRRREVWHPGKAGSSTPQSLALRLRSE